MTIVQLQATTPPSELHAAPSTDPRSLLEELIVLSRDCGMTITTLAARNKAKREMPSTLWAVLYQVFSVRKEILARAAAVCERPSTSTFFTSAIALKSLHEQKAKSLSDLLKGAKKPATGLATKAFVTYWNRISSANELEFIGALWLLETVLRPGYMLDELSPQVRTLKWSGIDEDRVITHLESLIREFAPLSTERILAGARQSAYYLKSLFADFEA